MLRSSKTFWITCLLVVLSVIRLGLLASYPLMDTTEARYAEIGRKMLELNDWITPWFDYQIPFWGKPPLSFWMTALSFKWLGVSEFSARLPHYLCGLLIIWMIWRWLRQESPQLAFTAITLLSTMLLFYGSSGLVMTDMWLLLGTTLSMMAFWRVVINSRELGMMRWLFFVGIAIGLLAKGPITLVVIGVPIVLWVLLRKEYRATWFAFPWIWGCILTLCLAGPWYIAAEFKTPGFLDYFLVGEHIKRFVVPGWEGDLYGTAHDRPRGTIWLFLFADTLPWSFMFILLALYLWKTGALTKPVKARPNGWNLYLLLWGLTPACFFTFAGNILWPYVLPGLPALAIWLADWLNNQKSINAPTRYRFLLTGTAANLILIVIAMFVYADGEIAEKRSAKSLIARYDARKSGNGRLVYFSEKPFSASFYTSGSAVVAKNASEITAHCANRNCFLAIRPKKESELPASIHNNLIYGETIGRYRLYQLATSLKQSASTKPGAILSVSNSTEKRFF